MKNYRDSVFYHKHWSYKFGQWRWNGSYSSGKSRILKFRTLTNSFVVAALLLILVCIPSGQALSLERQGVSANTPDDSSGVIRFVFGSDSSTPGIHLYTKTANYENFRFDLFRSPERQNARIMDPEFRDRFRDSSGEPFRFTWWMQGGSLYRYATNTNLPYNSLMSLYLMNKYHKESMEQYGDEFTYHYHTWIWSDAAGDGIYFWNQAPRYLDSREDFFRNMAEALIEEDMFPVSFRSGWHYMDNDWQADLDDWIPFSLHNDWPANRTDSPEPVNNINVWNEAPSDWVPFRPQSDNYMLPGGDRGWNTRSIHFTRVRESHIRDIFEAADQGIDQVPCIWSHVAENTFIEDLERVFGLIQMVAEEYPHIDFYYDTAIEAMQGWLQTGDTTSPVLTVEEIPAGEGHRIRVQSDKPLFMSRPFLAARDVYENHRRVEMSETGPLTWESDEILTNSNAVSWSVAATDSSGNLSKHHEDRLPRIIYIDDEDPGFSVSGSWWIADYHEIDAVWGAQAHVSDASSESASASWSATIPEAAHFDVQIRFPSGPERPNTIPYAVFLNEEEVKSGVIEHIGYDSWIFLHDAMVQAGDRLEVVISRDEGATPSVLTADVVRFTAYRPPVFLTTSAEIPDLGYVQRGDVREFSIAFENKGIESADITDVKSKQGKVTGLTDLPQAIPARSQRNLVFQFQADGYGNLRDTLTVETSDPGQPVIIIPVQAYGKGPFQLVDNDDEAGYEESGGWNRSVAEAYGSSSRWISISETNKDAYARYRFDIDESARYALSYIVPAAVNSALRAQYDMRINEELVLRRIVDQNSDLNHWKWLGSFEASADDDLSVTVSMADTDQPGRVLRADAVQIEQLGTDRLQVVIDTESDDYTESGNWLTSNSQAYGNSSRYTSSPDAQATYIVREVMPGLSELEVLLPTTENAVTRARYRAYRQGKLIGESIIDQNENSGDWVPVGIYQVDLPGDLEVVVDYPGSSDMDGVLRTDAIRWGFSQEGQVTQTHERGEFADRARLYQNYPNPFNPFTIIRFEVTDGAKKTRLAVYDVLGRQVAVLMDDIVPAGTHSVQFNGSALSSGVYLYRLETSGTVFQHKMMLIK